jgi:hypothetical protein
MANVKISIISEFLGKGLKDADKSMKGFEKSVKRVGYLFGGGYLGAKVLGFSKVAVKAFAADDNAARSLGLTIKNLGLGYEGASKSVNDYISNLEKQTGVLDDELRPAMDRMLRATGSITKAQDLLGLSLDIAAGTGKSLTQVSQSLQKAYLGQTQALGRLGVGLSKAELTSSSFEEIQNRLTVLFQGQAVSAANSYQGSIDKLTVAMNNAKEVIGQGMVDALTGYGGEGGLNGALNIVARSAQVVSDLFVGIGRTRGYLSELFTTKSGVSPLQAFRNAQALAASYRMQDKFGGVKPTGVVPSISSAVKADAIAKAEAKRQKELVALQKKQVAATKEITKSKKASAVFDMEQIQIAAALKGKITEEEAIRLKLQSAILMGNNSEAARLTVELSKTVGMTQELSTWLRNLPTAKNPFEAWQSYLDGIMGTLQRIATQSIPSAGFSMGGGAGYELPVNPYAGTYYGETGRDPMPVNIVISTTDQFASALRYDLLDNSLSGKQSAVDRNLGSF